MKLSALILAKNEEAMIEDCLKQLSFVDEIIVLDQNSQDKTSKIARQYASKVYHSNIDSFDQNRNTLAQMAKGEWLLYLDADERLNTDLAKEIMRVIGENQYGAYYFPRKNIILGRWLRHGGWWPDYVPRLFKKNMLLGWHGKIHESPKIKGDFGYIKDPIIHLTARSFSQMFRKTIDWAKVEAQLFYDSKSRKITSLKVLKSFTLEFFSRYFWKTAFLDGTVGLVESIFQALHQAIILTYLWELQNVKQNKPKP